MELIRSLEIAKITSGDKGLPITKYYGEELINKISTPKPSVEEILGVVDLALESLMAEMHEYHPRHFSAIITFAKELEKATSNRSGCEPKNLWDCLEGRGKIEDTGNTLIDRINVEKNPEIKVLLLGQYIQILYESQSANFLNFVNLIMNDYKTGIDQDSMLLLQTMLTLDNEHKGREIKALGKKGFRCEFCRIRNGFAHFRYEVYANGNLHIWDMKNLNSENAGKVFDKLYTLKELIEMMTAMLCEASTIRALTFHERFKSAFKEK